jgi:lipoprotein-anchoring transpeptidase ErfK/SrfK
MNGWIAGAIVYGLVVHQGHQSHARHTPAPKPKLDGLRLQVALDRAGFSVGEIDGRPGGKTRKALQAFQQARGLSVSTAPNAATWTALDAAQTPVPATVSYEITEEDAKGPFVETIPKDVMKQATLTQLGYTSIVEMLAERFHTSPTLLRRLNAGAKNAAKAFAAGSTVTVPNVEPLMPPQGSGRRKGAEASTQAAAATATGTAAGTVAGTAAGALAVEVVVSKEKNDLRALDANGAVIFYAPVSSGSAHDPLPMGDWTVRGVYLNPRFFYNPDLFWDADASKSKTRIAPGPNNPVGFAWIDLDRPHYGLHGTPEPSMVGVTQSHGCVRLTNWDIVRLAALVQEGTHVSFRP